MAVKKRAKRAGTVAIGTWPTPEKPARKRKAATKRPKKKQNPRAIDTVPLPDKPRRRTKKKAAAKPKAAKKKK